MTQLEYLQYNLNFVTISMHFNYFMETSACYLFKSVLMEIILLFINQRINFHLKNTLTIHIQFLHMFMLYNLCVCVCVCGVHLVILDCLWPYGVQPTGLLCPWDSPGKNTGVGSISFSRVSSRPRDWTCISWICRQILYDLATGFMV